MPRRSERAAPPLLDPSQLSLTSQSRKAKMVSRCWASTSRFLTREDMAEVFNDGC